MLSRVYLYKLVYVLFYRLLYETFKVDRIVETCRLTSDILQQIYCDKLYRIVLFLNEQQKLTITGSCASHVFYHGNVYKESYTYGQIYKNQINHTRVLSFF